MGGTNILISGLPGVGKTTLIKKIAAHLSGMHPVGFYTTEIRKAGIRQGFELISLSGDKKLLAHSNLDTPHRVGKYGIDVAGFEAFLGTMQFQNVGAGLVIIDEIGKMECFSKKFRIIVKELLNSSRPVLATVALKGKGFITDVKGRKDVQIFTVTEENRDLLADRISLLFTEQQG